MRPYSGRSFFIYLRKIPEKSNDKQMRNCAKLIVKQANSFKQLPFRQSLKKVNAHLKF